MSGLIPTIAVAAAFMAPATPIQQCDHVTAKDAEGFSTKTWRLIRWERGKPPQRVRAAHRRHVRCAAGPGHRKAIKERWRNERRVFLKHRVYMLKLEALTPYQCGAVGRFAIPCYVVACESRYSWDAYNPSGALGPYQLLGWGAPFPVTSRADRLAHHRIARELWAGGAGAGNWVCA
jgi:hypothetical protein